MDLSIIIVNYKSKEKLENNLASLELANLENINHEIVVVDNNSGDDLSELQKRYKNIRFIISEKNLGMGGGNNLGIKHSSGDYILIANPDLIFSKEAIKSLFQYLKENKDIAILGPKLINPDKSLQYSCARFPSIFIPFYRRTSLGRWISRIDDKYLMKKERHDIIKDVDWLLGACVMLRRGELFEAGNLFDERFFIYFEDVDLARRAASLKKRVVYYPLVSVIHDHARSSANLPWYKAIFLDKLAREHLRSWWKYFKKWNWH